MSVDVHPTFERYSNEVIKYHNYITSKIYIGMIQSCTYSFLDQGIYAFLSLVLMLHFHSSCRVTQTASRWV